MAISLSIVVSDVTLSLSIVVSDVTISLSIVVSDVTLSLSIVVSGVTLSLSIVVSDVTISLSAHPPFVLPRQGPGVDLREAFPPPLHKHLDEVTRLFSLDAGAVVGVFTTVFKRGVSMLERCRL